MSLPYAILGLLTYSPMNGYLLGKIFNQTLNNVWVASLSQIYRELDGLEKKGYVESSIQPQDDRPDKRVFTVTESGKTAFRQWLTNPSETFLAPRRDEFTLRLFFGGKMSKDELTGLFRQFVAERENLERMMDGISRSLPEINRLLRADLAPGEEKDMLCWRFIVKLIVTANRAAIQWAEECLAELSDLPD